MEYLRRVGLVAVALVLGACGSGANSTGFQSGFDASDGSRGTDTGLLGRSDGTTHVLQQPDGGKESGCANAVTCASEGVACGPINNGCGTTIQCGSCPTNTACGAGGTAGQCGTSCTPTTCQALGFNCGPAGDGCGGMLQCGSCSDAETCGGGGVSSQCGAEAMCVPTTCAKLGIDCGPAADGCGGMLQCGTSCPTGQLCGAISPGQCGTPPCTSKTCTELGVTCGETTDGCGNPLMCGTCTLPQACGGGGTPGVCGCTGSCAEVPTCPAPATTTLTGKVYDPGDVHPLYDVLVYVPNNPSDPALTTPFAAGVSCEQCGGASAAGNPLVSTQTAPDGSFTLSNIPVGTSIPLVIELGRWRRQFTVNVASSCGANAVTTGNTTPVKWLSATQPTLASSGHLTMPTSSQYGDIPRISIVTGGFDPMECVLRKMGVADSEFTDPGGTGHIQFYLATEAAVPANPFGAYAPYCPANPYGSGAIIDGSTPSAASLFGTSGGSPTIDQYDVVILACEGYEENVSANWSNLGAYTSAGGRVLMSDYSYAWMAKTTACTSTSQCATGAKCTNGFCAGPNNATENPAYSGVATWDTDQNPGGSTETATLDLVSNPKGMAFQQWLQDVGVVATGASTMSLDPVFHNSNAIVAPTQQWLYDGTSTPIQFTFNTPVGATAANQCGLAAFMDWHADTLGFPNAGNYPECPYEYSTTAPYYSHGLKFPAECDNNPMTPQEAVVEFMLFDVSSCVTPYQATCVSESCSQQGIQCGPAGDGCGNLLQCGTCPSGQTCGGGGTPGVCGDSCVATTCLAQGISCGPAGDGCGNELQCGSCPAGETCGGGGTPGKCGSGTCAGKTCAQQSIACGPAGDGCGNLLQCGTCPAGQTCGGGGTPGQCGDSCVPKTCAGLGFNCGPAGDGCGNALSCGTCTGANTCGGGGTAGVCGSGGPK